MTFGKDELLRYLRTLLILGRVSNLPTVWSNCLAAWLLGGGDLGFRFALACLGATFLYTGGMFLNDAFDVDFDRQHRRERPVPSGAIQLKAVWILGTAWLLAGVLLLGALGKATLILTLILTGTIVLYDAVHKAIMFSPLMMAACRFWLYLAVASAASNGVVGLVIWSALVLAAYIVGLSYIARTESVRGPLRYWPCYLLGFPVVLAVIVNSGQTFPRSILLSTLLIGWIAYSLRHSFQTEQRNVGRTVSGLLAGIVFVDWLAVAFAPLSYAMALALLFGLALFFQRFIPAT